VGTVRPVGAKREVYLKLLGAENLRDQATSVNHASGAIAPLDPELIQIRDTVGPVSVAALPASGRGAPVGVGEVLVLAQHDHQVPLIPHQGSVQQLAAARADPSVP
jgi:hypothetical protein